MPLSFRESPLRDCLETPNGLRFVVPRAHTRGRNGTIFGAPRYRGKPDPTRLDTFQTVSLGSLVNRGENLPQSRHKASLKGFFTQVHRFNQLPHGHSIPPISKKQEAVRGTSLAQ